MPRQPRVALDVRGLIDRVEIFRLSGASKRDPLIDTWLAEVPVELRSIAQQWFAQMRRCGDDVLELMHDAQTLRILIESAYADIKAHLAAERSSRD